MTERNKNISNYGNSAQMKTTQLVQIMMEVWNFQNLSQKLKMKLRKIDPIIMAVIVTLDGIEVVAIIITAIVIKIMIEVII
jgi:hypothetical protein